MCPVEVRAPVAVGGVQEVDPMIVRRVHDRVRVRLLGLRAKVHGAQTKAGDGEAGAAEVSEVHDATLALRPWRAMAGPDWGGDQREPVVSSGVMSCGLPVGFRAAGQ